jgi:hypothetical protein
MAMATWRSKSKVVPSKKGADHVTQGILQLDLSPLFQCLSGSQISLFILLAHQNDVIGGTGHWVSLNAICGSLGPNTRHHRCLECLRALDADVLCMLGRPGVTSAYTGGEAKPHYGCKKSTSPS